MKYYTNKNMRWFAIIDIIFGGYIVFDLLRILLTDYYPTIADFYFYVFIAATYIVSDLLTDFSILSNRLDVTIVSEDYDCDGDKNEKA